jgi:methylated-DNA-[protein]-cysteine S-methyltransferase
MKLTSNVYEVLIRAPFGAIGLRTRDGLVSEIALIPSELADQASASAQKNEAVEQIQSYLNNPKTKPNFKCLALGTPYQQRVWQAISQIPCGETRTYAELAQQIGSGPRAVANACGANPLPLLVPCHRVVAKNGLGGFMQGVEGGLELKKWLLAHESK